MLWNNGRSPVHACISPGVLACSISVPQDAAGDSVMEHLHGHMTAARYGREDQLCNQKSNTPETP
jgi:hypothetical protein